MGYEDKKGKSRKGGAPKKQLKFRNRGSFRFSEVDAAVLLDIVEQLTAAGCLVMLMSSSDRNIRGIKIRHDDVEETATEWLNSEDDLVSYVEAYLETLNT